MCQAEVPGWEFQFKWLPLSPAPHKPSWATSVLLLATESGGQEPRRCRGLLGSPDVIPVTAQRCGGCPVHLKGGKTESGGIRSQNPDLKPS